jgi:hypothetical protein
MMDCYDERLQEAASRVLISLRQGHGIDSGAVVALKDALRNAAAAWSSSDTIPKSSANLFVDLGSGIESCRYLYSGQESEQIALLADEIGDLVRRCVSDQG